MSNDTYILQKDYLCNNGGSGITYGKGMEVTNDKYGQYYFFHDGNMIYHSVVENNPEWFKLKEEEPPIEITISLKQVKDGVEHRETFQTDYQEPLFRASIYDNIVKMRKRMEEKSTPKEDKIHVIYFGAKEVAKMGKQKSIYEVHFSDLVPSEKYEALKEAIGFVLNNDSYYMKAYPAEKLYSETQLLEAEQKAFYAAKETLPFPEYQREVADIPHSKAKYPDKYKTFEDYKNQTLNH